MVGVGVAADAWQSVQTTPDMAVVECVAGGSGVLANAWQDVQSLVANPTTVWFKLLNAGDSFAEWQDVQLSPVTEASRCQAGREGAPQFAFPETWQAEQLSVSALWFIITALNDMVLV